MGKVLDCLGPSEEEFILKQKVFFVATAPLSSECHVNVSPRTPGTSITVIDPLKIAMADLTGSGSETAAHIIENQRITFLFCNIEAGPPKLLRIHGTAKLIIKENVPTSLLNKFPTSITSSYGFRCIYLVNVHRISTSCGYSMPIMKFEKYRQVLNEWTSKHGVDGIQDYSTLKNSFSIDGLPSLGLLRYDAFTTTNVKSKMKIIPSKQDGYIYGKLVKEGEEESKAMKMDGKGGSNVKIKNDLMLLKGDGLFDISSLKQHQQHNSKWDWLSFSCGVAVGGIMVMIMMLYSSPQFLNIQPMGTSWLSY